MAIWHGYWHQVVKNANFTLLLTAGGQEWQLNIATDIQCQEWQFHIATDIYWSTMAISHCYWASSGQEWQFHIATSSVVKNGNFTLLLTSSGQQWQFHIATDIQWSTMAISHCYWHQVVKWMAISHCYCHHVVKNGNFTLLLTFHKWSRRQFHIATDIMWAWMVI